MTTAPSQRTARATLAYRRAQRQLEDARVELRAAVLEDLAAGVSQAHLARVTGYSREQLRRIARDAGLPAAR